MVSGKTRYSDGHSLSIKSIHDALGIVNNYNQLMPDKKNFYNVNVTVVQDKGNNLSYYNHNVLPAEEYKKIEDTYTGAHGTGYSRSGQNPQEVSSFANSITGKAKVYKQQRGITKPHTMAARILMGSWRIARKNMATLF